MVGYRGYGIGVESPCRMSQGTVLCDGHWCADAPRDKALPGGGVYRRFQHYEVVVERDRL